MEILLLGPVEARIDGVEVSLTPLERNLIAMLALARGAVVSTERIIDGLWDDRPPAVPRSRVQGLVSSLRRKLGKVLATRHPGYALEMTGVACDLVRCEDLARLARSVNSRAETAERLREALALWRGEPLDGAFAPGVDAERARLSDLRVGLLEECFDAELELGRHLELVGELSAAVNAYPLRERLTGELMLALYRGNRQADALRAYDALRVRLADELGADPCADLRELRARILRGEDLPAPEPGERTGVWSHGGGEARRPAQLPASVGHFTGRDTELAELAGALPGSADEPRVLLVSGAGGVGKSALAVRWAHRVTDRFADGQIYVDLRGGSGGEPTTPTAALAAVLPALGVSAARLPDGLEELAALYRTLMHGRRMLVVADDAAAASQLLPLVPPTPGSVLLATSRHRLTALLTHHDVRTLVLSPLSSAESWLLLERIVGPQRLREEGADELIALCHGWPLAIRLAGATLAARPGQPLASFAEELRDGLDTLSVAGDGRSVTAALADAYARLDPPAGQLLARLGLLVNRSFCAHLAAAVNCTSVARVRRLLDALVSVNLLVETGFDRYGCHDMVWRFVRRRGSTLIGQDEVRKRALTWYLTVLNAAAGNVAPGTDSGLVPASWSPFPMRPDRVRAFLDAETPNVAAILRWLHVRGDQVLARRLDAVARAAGVGLPAVAAESAWGVEVPRSITGDGARRSPVLPGDPSRGQDREAGAHEAPRRLAHRSADVERTGPTKSRSG